MYNGGWHRIAPGELPIIMLVKEGSAIPHFKLAQSTMQMDWSQLELKLFVTETTDLANGKVCLPADNILCDLLLKKDSEGKYTIEKDTFSKKVKWTIRK